MTFREWYSSTILPLLYAEQAEYERNAVAFQAIEKLSANDILDLYRTMELGELRLALFDHVKACIAEQWHPDDEPEEFRDDSPVSR